MTNQYAPVAAQRTNVLAIVTLVLSIVGFNVISVILGFVALNQIKRTGEAGKGLAIAGIVISIVYIVLIIGLIIFIVALGGFAALVSSSTPTTY